MLKYKAGYLVEIDTYENDGDNSKTKYHDGLTKEQAIFLGNIGVDLTQQYILLHFDW